MSNNKKVSKKSIAVVCLVVAAVAWLILPGEDIPDNIFADPRDTTFYRYVQINDQIWMAENLNYAMAGSHCLYDSLEMCKKYGRLYTFSDAQKACPKGWRIPTVDDVEELVSFIGDHGNAGGLLKTIDGWEKNTGTDLYGFAGLPSGTYAAEIEKYGAEGHFNDIWTSVEYKGKVISFGMSYRHDSLLYTHCGYGDMASVRCLKDTIIDLTEPEGIAENESTFGEGAASENGRNQARNQVLKDSRDGTVYKTVPVGNKIWMAENLNLDVEGSWCYNNDPENCKTYGRLYLWSAAVDSVARYSDAAQGCGYRTECKVEGNLRGICPEGWHLPSYNELDSLIGFAGDVYSDRYKAGLALKATSLWKESYGKNGGGEDKLGFTAIPAGDFSNGSFYNLGEKNRIWSSTERSDYSANYLILDNYYEKAELDYDSKNMAFSVRCVKD